MILLVHADKLFYHKLDERDQGKKLEDILRRRFRFSRKMIQRLKVARAVRLDGKEVYLTSRGRLGQMMAVDLFEQEEQTVAGEDLPLDILYEDDFFMAVNKPAGQIIHPVGPHVRGTLANAAAGYWQRKGEERIFRPVFRIDRDTSGVVLVAKNRFAHQQMSVLSEEGGVNKVYLGIVQGEFPKNSRSGIFRFPMRPKAGSKILQEIHPQGKMAETEYRVLGDDAQPGCSLVEFRLITGRTHQIRVHCQAVGHPLLGDGLYGTVGGSPEDTEQEGFFARQALHALRYAFRHPFTGEHVAIIAPLAADMGDFIQERWGDIVEN